MNKNLLAWFLFLKMDEIPVGGLTPGVLKKILAEYERLSEEEITQQLREEFSADDLSREIAAVSTD